MQTTFILGTSPTFAETIREAAAFAASDCPVLLWGETGVGKDRLAQYIHSLSDRTKALFLPINCAALPNGLFESELFGYQRGAFSGAHVASKGLIRSASGGTVFLDEVGELDLGAQVKLLRLLDNAEVRPLGGLRPEYCDVRWIAATNVDLPAAVAEGRFRHDLYERLSVLSLRVPPLRERPEDIEFIAREVFAELGAQYEESALQELPRYLWPGNVRQLRNVLTRATILGRKVVTRALLHRILREDESIHAVIRLKRDQAFSGSLDEIEQRAVIERLWHCRGNRKKAAEELGIAKSTLHEKLRKWKGTSVLSSLGPCVDT